MNKTLIIISKLIFFYSLFYVVIKLIAVVFKNAWAVPNLILILPFLVFALLGGIMIKKNDYSWIYAIAGLIIISVIRYFEHDWAIWLHENLG